MKKSNFLVLLLAMTFAAVAGMDAQQPQCPTCPLYGVNAKYLNGTSAGYAPTAGSGLTLNLSAGRTRCGNTMVNYAAGTLTMANNTTNYVYLDTSASCVPTSNTSGYTSTGIAIATVVTSGGAITSFTDDRTLGMATSAGGVTSVFSRTGAVVAQTGDYTAAQVTGAASQTGVQGESYVYAADTGTANTYVVTLSPVPGSYSTGLQVVFKAANANTGTSTLNVNGLGAQTIKKLGTSNLVANDITAGLVVTVVYDGTNFQMGSGLGNPPGAVTSVFGRVGAVVATNGDYSASQVTNAADQASIQNESYIYATDTGAANAYAIAPTPSVTSLIAGQGFVFKAANGNSGASTLNVNSLGATAIKKWSGSSTLASGDIAAGQIVHVVYDGTNFQMSVPVANSGGGSLTDQYVIGSSSSSLPNAVVFPDLIHSPDVPPASGNAMDCEFDGSTICSFTWVNQGSATATVSNGHLDLFAPSPGGVSNNLHIIEQTLPSAPWAFTTKLEFSGIVENYHSCGMVLRESATGKIFYWAIQMNGSVVGNPTIYGEAYASVTGGTSTKYNSNQSLAAAYLRVARSGTTLTFSFSPMGTGWMPNYNESITTDFTTAPDQVGLACDAINASDGMDGIFWWFRRTT